MRNSVVSHDLRKYSNQNVIRRRDPEIETRPVISLICSATGRFLNIALVSI